MIPYAIKNKKVVYNGITLKVKEATSYENGGSRHYCGGCNKCYFATFKHECSTVVAYCKLKMTMEQRNCNEEFRADGKRIYYVAAK